MIRVKYLPLALAFITAVGLSLESYLSLSNKSICHAEACAVVGKYLTIGTPWLVAGGAAFFWLLALVLFFALRYPGTLKFFPLILLALALAIDSSLMGFQFFTIQQTCLLCISVAVLLAGIVICYCYATQSFLVLTCLALVWAGGFGVHALLRMPSPQAASANMVFFTTQTTESPSTTSDTTAKLTLIISMNCPHCLEVVSVLAERYPLGITINLVAIDADPTSLAKLSFFVQQAPASTNPLQLLKEIKEGSANAVMAPSPKIKIQTENGLSFLNNLGIFNIPVLLSESSSNKKEIWIGSTAILSFLETMKQTGEQTVPPSM